MSKNQSPYNTYQVLSSFISDILSYHSSLAVSCAHISLLDVSQKEIWKEKERMACFHFKVFKLMVSSAGKALFLACQMAAALPVTSLPNQT